jgi:hypothetical protein
MDIELITGKDVAFLDTQQFPIVMNALLVAEAGQNRVSLLDLTVTSQTNDPDGGIDARLLWPAQFQHDVLAPGANILQYKAGKISTEILANEFSKPDVQAAIQAGNTYVFCVGYDYPDKWVKYYRARERCLAEIVKRGEAVLARWPDVDMRAVGVAVLEQRKPVEYRRGGNAVEARKHPTITQDTDIVEGRLDSREHFANCGFGLIHRGHPSNLLCPFSEGGVQGSLPLFNQRSSATV